MENLEDSFKNPFSEYNASVMDSNRILEYWCSPFAFSRSTPIFESDIYQDKMPIVFMGGRGTGKTMFLRYFSYTTQRDKALRDNKEDPKAILSHLQATKGLGFYLKIDGPALWSFEGKGVDAETWDNIFIHYFELQVCKKYIEVIKDLVDKAQLNRQEIEKAFIPKLVVRLGKTSKELRTIEAALDDVERKIDEVSNFRGKVAFSNVEFCPKLVFKSQDLSFRVVEIAKETISEFAGINFVLLMDEYENYSERQQRVINTLMRFCQDYITLRIGMRLEAFRTYGTTSEKEFIRENRDYRRIVFEEILIKDTDYRKFLLDVARKRLEAVPFFRDKGYTDISKILGKTEDVEQEALDLTKNRENPRKHFDLLRAKSSKIPIEDIYEKLKNPGNPLLEMLNILWFLRDVSPDTIQKSMSDYLKKEKTERERKYRFDYVDKYKLSLMFLLNSQYRRNKSYYSFNTFGYLSSGIVGLFIELCRRTFQHAIFEDPKSLTDRGKISADLQTRAAREVANAELEMNKRIPRYGQKLYAFAVNLGNIFSEYHKDIFIRYPETNQFSLSTLAIADREIKNTFDSALEWSIILKKPFPQQETPGGPRTDIYTLNRIFSPIFNLTYRTRGGFSEESNELRLKELMTGTSVKPIKNLERQSRIKSNTSKTGGLQPPLDLGNDE